jgi:outer membrane protein OmpA-like peptidoglycan-associated protein
MLWLSPSGLEGVFMTTSMWSGVLRGSSAIVAALALMALPAMCQDSGVTGDYATGYHIHVITRSTQAVDYRRTGSTHVDLRGTDLMPEIKGDAKVESRTGRIEIDASFDHVRPPSTFGLTYLTYVLWAITPQGSPRNLGELVLNRDHGSLKVTADLQAFALILTAEPYFAVSQPSDLVVAQDIVRQDTKGRVESVVVKYDLLPRDIYAAQVSQVPQPMFGVDNKIPLDLLEARNALRIARDSHAEQYAASTFAKAQALLDQAEDYYRRKQGMSPIGTVAREASQTAEEARIMTLKAEQEEAEQKVRDAARKRAEDAEAAAKAQHEEAEAQQRAAAQAEAAAQQAQAAQQTEALQRQQADAARASAEQAKAQADEARHQAELAQQQAAQQAQLADQARQQAEAQTAQLRARLLAQLNQVLQTRDTARGLIVSMPDVLFDTGKANLRPAARERLARVAGILLAYPDIRLEIDGFTDSTGSLAFNEKLSMERATGVESYLAQQGVAGTSMTTQGFGPDNPIAPNTTSAGRQQNRRVEMVVSGESIGAAVSQSGANGGAPGMSGPAQPAMPDQSTPAQPMPAPQQK